MGSNVAGTGKESTNSVKFVAYLALFLLVGNFMLDMARRFDFEAEAEALNSERRSIDDVVEHALLLTANVDTATGDLFGELGAVKDALREFEGRLEELLALGAAGAKDGAVLDASAGNGDHHSSSDAEPVEDLRGPLARLLDAPVEELQQRLEEAQADEYTQRVRPSFKGINSWKIEDIIRDAEEYHGVSLETEERQILEARLEMHRMAARATWSQYVMGLRQSLSTRIQEGDYVQSADNLAAHDLGTPSRFEDPKEALAVHLIGSNAFTWARSDFPKLNRLDLLWKTVPSVAIEELRTFMEERILR